MIPPELEDALDEPLLCGYFARFVDGIDARRLDFLMATRRFQTVARATHMRDELKIQATPFFRLCQLPKPVYRVT